LPSSQYAWKVACEILDEGGGWIHVHGNCRDTDIEAWTSSVLSDFQSLFKHKWSINVRERFRVKEFGPGVGHWVLDLYCSKG